MQTDSTPPVQCIGIPRETFPGEKRVATVPDVVEKLIKLGFKVAVQAGAGEAANFSDDAYRAAGAEVIDGAAALWAAPGRGGAPWALNRRDGKPCSGVRGDQKVSTALQ